MRSAEALKSITGQSHLDQRHVRYLAEAAIARPGWQSTQSIRSPAVCSPAPQWRAWPAGLHKLVSVHHIMSVIASCNPQMSSQVHSTYTETPIQAVVVAMLILHDSSGIPRNSAARLIDSICISSAIYVPHWLYIYHKEEVRERESSAPAKRTARAAAAVYPRCRLASCWSTS